MCVGCVGYVCYVCTCILCMHVPSVLCMFECLCMYVYIVRNVRYVRILYVFCVYGCTYVCRYVLYVCALCMLYVSVIIGVWYVKSVCLYVSQIFKYVMYALVCMYVSMCVVYVCTYVCDVRMCVCM